MPPSPLTLVSTHTATTYSFHATDGHLGWANCTVCDSTGQISITSDWGSWQHRWSPDPKNLGAPTLTAFIGTRGDVDYLARKLQNEGHNGHVFSGEKTAKALQRRLCERRLEQGREQLENRLEPEDMPNGRPLGHLAGMHDGQGLPLFGYNYVDAPTFREPSRRERLPYLTRDAARALWNELRALGQDCDRHCDLFYERVMQIDGFTGHVTEEPWEYGETEQTPGDRALRDVVLPALIEACRDAVDQRALDAMRPAQRAELDAMARGEIVPCGPIPDPERRCACHQEAGDSLCEVHPPPAEELAYAESIGAPYTKPCTNYSPAGFTGHWREWHRGHGCDKDDGKPRTDGGR